MKKIRGFILCGYPGTGKTKAAKNIPGVVDLGFAPFDNLDQYIKVASYLAFCGYIVCIESRKELRRKLLQNKERFITVLPDPKLKKMFIKRITESRKDADFAEWIDKNWNDTLAILPYEKTVILRQNSFRDATIEDYYLEIIQAMR